MARNTFVFGIGGTGARVIRALTMLLASGVKPAHEGKIIPIIIDVDAENEDTSRTIKALDLYKKIRTVAYNGNTENSGGFFATPVDTLRSQRAEGNENISDGFQLKFAGISSTFASYLRTQDMAPIDEDFLKLLYDASPASKPETELNLSLTKGFKGNPNIGCIIFNELEYSPEFRYFQNAIGEDDRIFIVSSIFGGTGSAGFPQLLKLLKNSRNNRVSSARTGALTMMPYFSVQEDPESAIDSNRFISKTKAALSYYENEMDHLSAMYYLYDKAGNTPYKNNEGGKAQKNDAHLAELIGAMAVLNFTNKKDEDFEHATMYYEYGIKKDDTTIDVRHFSDHDKTYVLHALTSFTYAAKIYVHHLPEALRESFAKELKLEREMQSGNFYQALSAFFKEHYLQWLGEMERNNRAFRPFALQDTFNAMVVGKPVNTGFIEKGISTGYLNTHLGKIEHELRKTIPAEEQRFLKLLDRIAEKCFEKLERLPA
jgi:hypothetical protein